MTCILGALTQPEQGGLRAVRLSSCRLCSGFRAAVNPDEGSGRDEALANICHAIGEWLEVDAEEAGVNQVKTLELSQFPAGVPQRGAHAEHPKAE